MQGLEVLLNTGFKGWTVCRVVRLDCMKGCKIGLYEGFKGWLVCRVGRLY